MKEYAHITLSFDRDLGEYLTQKSKEGWDVFQPIQQGVNEYDSEFWHIIFVREVEG